MEKKTSTDRVRAFRERKKANKPPRKVPTSTLERSREYRARRGVLKKHGGQHNLPTTSNTLDESIPSLSEDTNVPKSPSKMSSAAACTTEFTNPISTISFTHDSSTDLIDFGLKSFELPPIDRSTKSLDDTTLANAGISTTHFTDESENNLLDSELVQLEQRLLNNCSPDITRNEFERQNGDVLINLDDLDGVIEEGTTSSINCCDDDDQEALDILLQLDEVLEAQLRDNSELTIEDCLLELDNYLRSFDDESKDEWLGNDLAGKGPPLARSSSLRLLKTKQQAVALAARFAALTKHKQRGHSQPATIGAIRCSRNAATVGGSNGNDDETVQHTTPLNGRTNIASDRTTTPPTDVPSTSFVLGDDVVIATDLPTGRISGTSAAQPSTNSPSAVYPTDVHQPSTSCNSINNNPGVVVEAISPAHMATNIDAYTVTTSASIAHTKPPEGLTVAPSERSSTTWLRNSMRRIRPIQLPDNDIEDVQQAPTDQLTTPNPTQPEMTLQSAATRPFSAPSRLPSNPTQVRSSRSRARTSANPPRNYSGSNPATHRTSRNGAAVSASGSRARSSSNSSRSRRGGASLSSSVSSLGSSSVDTTPSCTPTPAQEQREVGGGLNSVEGNLRSCDRQSQEPSSTRAIPTAASASAAADMPEAAESPLGQWSHSLSSMLACLGCTLGLFNISRFAILSVHFGANFILQFFLLSLLIGIPLFSLQLCLGQQLGAGVIDMWRISPMFQGVGVSLLFFQAMAGLYSITGISWMFVYFRDAFITKMDRYRWAEPFHCYHRNDSFLYNDEPYKISDTVPEYLSGTVLQRTGLANGTIYGTIKFQPAFNLAVIWLIVFVSLSKGLRSYGKVIYVFTLLPIFATFVLCTKIFGLMPHEYVNEIFPETTWNEFFVNSKSWLAASQEAFLTWGLLSASVMQIASHNKNKFLLQRDSSLIAVITFTILLLVAFLANTCVQILRANGYTYVPNSFERMSTYTFLRFKSDPLPPHLASTPVKYMVHNSFLLGERVNRPNVNIVNESGYQVLRFATELVPATFAVLGTDKVSPFWAVLFYFILILFGIAQQLAIWHSVITGIIAVKAHVLKAWETTITFFSCACGFLLGLPMTTELGIFVVYFMDLSIGGVWWLLLIILMQILAVFMVRGRPYSGDTVVTALFNANSHPCWAGWAPTLLSFTWNVILPIVLIVWCITFFKNGNFRELFVWHHAPSLEYWPLWARQIGSLLQLFPVLAVPFIAVVQSYRYLNNGPPDILVRIQLLYRPPLGEHMADLNHNNNNGTSDTPMTPATTTTTVAVEDPPPKYTPPPSYSTATGAKIARLLRQSFRRSVRRIATTVLGTDPSTSRGTGGVSGASRGGLDGHLVEVQIQPPPPDYSVVLVEMNARRNRDVTDSSSTPSTARPNLSSPPMSTFQRELATIASSSSAGLTAADVASILRSSFRRSTVRNHRRKSSSAATSPIHNTNATCVHNAIYHTTLSDPNMSSLSAENLIESAAPIGETSLVHLTMTDDVDIVNGQEKERNVSVI